MFDANTTVLIVEDSHTVRQSLRAMLSMASITRAEAVATAAEGRKRLKSRSYDVVLCDYNLGDGMDGQELLEVVRKEGLLPLGTIWIMITGERKYERVVAAAEMAPDDYILKPFTSNILMERLDGANKRKDFLRPAYRLIESGRNEEAIALLARMAQEAASGQQRLDALRLRAELLVNAGRQPEALTIYQELLSQRIIPWARMGVARIYSEDGNTAEANELLKEIVAEAPLYTDAYDRLAQNLLDDGQYQAAMEVLEKAVAISPRNFHRLKSCGQAALRVGDPKKAAEYLQRAVDIGRNNAVFGPDVLADLVQAYCESGETQTVDRLQAEISALSGNDPSGRFVLAVCRAVSAQSRGRQDEALAGLHSVAGQLAASWLDFPSALRFLGAAAKLPAELPDNAVVAWASQITLRFVHVKHDLGEVLETIKGNQACIAAVHQAYASLQQQNNRAVELVSDGKVAEAGSMLYQVAMSTLNERTGMNACAMLLRVYEELRQKGEAFQQEFKQYEVKLLEILDWLPRENERVQGFWQRLEVRA
jgi:DNA-binding response OmpR family regulator